MPKLTFYHQARFDGGRRTGISLDDDATSLHFFETGAAEEDYDPRLLWYVDLRCEGNAIPGEPQAARDWFLDNEAYFVAARAECR